MLAADGRFEFEVFQALVEKAKPYTIHVFKWQYEKLYEEGMICQDIQKKFSFLNEAMYSSETGLNFDREDDVKAKRWDRVSVFNGRLCNYAGASGRA